MLLTAVKFKYKTLMSIYQFLSFKNKTNEIRTTGYSNSNLMDPLFDRKQNLARNSQFYQKHEMQSQNFIM